MPDVELPFSREPVAPESVGVDATRAADLVARAQTAVTDDGLPAAQVALAREGRLAVHATVGAAGPNSRFVRFSTTKALVAGAMWLLQGDGDIDVEAPVASYIPEFATNDKDQITVEQLLLHTSGFPHAPLGPPEWSSRPGRVAAFARWRLNWEPGSRVEYHPSSAHWVLAELIERQSGIDYRRFVAERVCAPLGLPRLQLGAPVDDQADICDLVAVGTPPTPAELEAATGVAGIDLAELDFGEVGDASLLRFNEPETRALGIPGGGAVGTAGDMALYLQALLHNPSELWEPDTLADGTGVVRATLDDAMLAIPANRTRGLIVAGDDGFALRRGMGKTTSARAFGHHGAAGQIAWADPETGLSFCFLTNGVDASLLAEGRRRAALSNRAGAALAA